MRTELMPTWRDLWHQRQRWQRGALENIGMYGMSSATARYWTQQFALGYGVLALGSYLALTVLSYLAFGVFTVVIFWALIGALFAVERTVTVWPGGWRARLLAAPLLIELVYATFLQLVYVKSLIDIALGRSKHWNRRHRHGPVRHERPGHVEPHQQPLVRAARRLRRLQHRRLRRTRLRQTVAPPTPMNLHAGAADPTRLPSTHAFPCRTQHHPRQVEARTGSNRPVGQDSTVGAR